MYWLTAKNYENGLIWFVGPIMWWGGLKILIPFQTVPWPKFPVECPSDVVPYPGNNGGDCFKLYNTTQFWEGAKTQCESYSGAQLSSIHSLEENVFVRGK